MCGMIVIKRPFQARTLSLSAIRMADRRGRAACDVDLATPRTGTFARAG